MFYSKALLLILIFLCSVGLNFYRPSMAQASPSKKLSEIQDQLKSTLRDVQRSREKEKSIADQMDDIEKEIRKKEKELKRYDSSMVQTELQIEQIKKEVNSLMNQMGDRMQMLREELRALYKRQYRSNALILISVTDYQDLIRKSKYVSMLAYHDSRVIGKYSADIQGIYERKKELEVLNNDQKNRKQEALQKTRELANFRTKKDKLLAMVRNKRSVNEKKIEELEETSKKMQEMINGLHAGAIPQSILGNGFTSLKGRLPWPLPGRVLIPYGRISEPGKNTGGLKDGIEIGSKTSTKAKAVAGGRVVYADDFQGYGKLVIIDHGDGYHSLYGNLQNFDLSSGDLLVEGMDIGKVGRSRDYDVPSLYFEIRYRGKSLNPVEWLTRQSERTHG